MSNCQREGKLPASSGGGRSSDGGRQGLQNGGDEAARGLVKMVNVREG